MKIKSVQKITKNVKRAFFQAKVNVTKKLETCNYTCREDGKFLYSIIVVTKVNSDISKRRRAQIIQKSIWAMRNQINGIAIATERQRPII